jgi:hypothetical protein
VELNGQLQRAQREKELLDLKVKDLTEINEVIRTRVLGESGGEKKSRRRPVRRSAGAPVPGRVQTGGAAAGGGARTGGEAAAGAVREAGDRSRDAVRMAKGGERRTGGPGNEGSASGAGAGDGG